MKIGIFFDGNYIKNYEVEELQRLLKTKNKFTFFISKDKKKEPKNFSFLRLILFHKFYSLILMERKFAEIFKKKYSFKKKLIQLNKKVSLHKAVPNINKYKKFSFKMKKFQNEYKFENKIQKVIKKNCDICILLGLNKIIHFDMLNISKNGIISFHTADTNFYRGRPSGFYEFVDNVKFGGVTLQRLSNNLDKGEVIFKKTTNISKCRSPEEVLYKMMKLKKDMLINAIKRITYSYEFTIPKNTKLNLQRDSQNLGIVLKCLIKTIYRRYII